MGLFDFFKKKETQKPKITVTFSAHEYTPDELRQQQEDKVLEIKRLARNSIPSKNGLRPHEIAMLSHATHYKTSGNDFPRYWHFDYGIDDPQAVLDMLLDRGFIRAETAKESIEKLKVPELKNILLEFGVVAKGKKADLMEAVSENISEEDLARKIPIRRYAVTELGEEELKENEYVTYFGGSDKYGLTVWDMNKMLQNYPNKLYRDKVWGELNRQLMENTGSRQFGLYRNTKYDMYKFLLEENRYDDAFFHLAEAFFYDMNGDISPVIAPALIKNFCDIEQKLDRSDEQMIGILQNLFRDMYAPCRRYTNDEVICMIVAYSFGHDEVAEEVFSRHAT